MSVNSTLIYNQTGLVAQVAAFNSETGYIFGIAIIAVIGLVAFFKTSNRPLSDSLLYGFLYAFLASLPLWLFEWVTWQACLVLICLLGATLLFKRFTEE